MLRIIKFRKFISEHNKFHEPKGSSKGGQFARGHGGSDGDNDEDMDLISRADKFAERAHAPQKRKYTFEPYVEHTREVAQILRDHGRPDEEIAAALLHDTVEDTPTTHEDILKHFGPKVAQLVDEVTDVSQPRGNHVKLHMKDRPITIHKPKRAREDQLVWIDVDKFDKAFERDKDAYVGPGGTGNAIGDRYSRFKDFLKNNDQIDTSEVYVNEHGQVGFSNGRHRYSVFRDSGVKHLPVSMTPESIANAKNAKHKILSNREARKELDRHHLAGASAGGQNIKMADLVSNTKSIVANDKQFAKVYLKEKRAILGVTDKAHPKLKQLAMDHLIAGEKALGL